MQVGDREDSAVYIRMKIRGGAEVREMDVTEPNCAGQRVSGMSLLTLWPSASNSVAAVSRIPPHTRSSLSFIQPPLLPLFPPTVAAVASTVLPLLPQIGVQVDHLHLPARSTERQVCVFSVYACARVWTCDYGRARVYGGS